MKGRIVAPMSRLLAVADRERSVTFYRDILGFDTRPGSEDSGTSVVAEVVSGPARIQLSAQRAAVDSTGDSRPRGAAMLFFETDDVAGLRDAVLARGGTPTELEKVNWIKMRMFQLEDPDGHTLWFGQSFPEPDPDRDPSRQLRQVLPEFPISDIQAGIDYYQKVLGFKINYAQDNVGIMYRDDVTLILVPKTELRGGPAASYVYVNDADALHAELVTRGADVQGEPVSHPWGLRDFPVLDLDGNRITFGQPFE